MKSDQKLGPAVPICAAGGKIEISSTFHKEICIFFLDIFSKSLFISRISMERRFISTFLLISTFIIS